MEEELEEKLDQELKALELGLEVFQGLDEESDGGEEVEDGTTTTFNPDALTKPHSQPHSPMEISSPLGAFMAQSESNSSLKNLLFSSSDPASDLVGSGLPNSTSSNSLSAFANMWARGTDEN